MKFEKRQFDQVVGSLKQKIGDHATEVIGALINRGAFDEEFGIVNESTLKLENEVLRDELESETKSADDEHVKYLLVCNELSNYKSIGSVVELAYIYSDICRKSPPYDEINISHVQSVLNRLEHFGYNIVRRKDDKINKDTEIPSVATGNDSKTFVSDKIRESKQD